MSSTTHRALAPATVAASLLCVTFACSLTLRVPDAYGLGVVPVACVASLVALAALLHRRAGWPAGASAATVALASSAGVLVACALSLRAPITDVVSMSDAVGAWRRLRVGAPVMAALVAVGALVAHRLRKAAPERVLRVVRAGAVTSLVASLALAGAAVAWSSRAPSSDRYATSLPAFVRLPAQTHLRETSLMARATTCRDAAPLGEVVLVRECTGACGASGGVCTLGLAPNARRLVPGAASFGAVEPSSACVHDHEELLVRLDDARDLLVVEASGAPRAVLDMRALRPVSASAATLRPALAPPRAWITATLFGGLMALALLVVSRRRRTPDPVEATLRDDGALVHDGRALTGVAVPPGVEAGSVVVFLARAMGAAHYRDDVPQAGSRVESGTLADHRVRLAARAWSWSMLAWAVAALAGAPLLAWSQVVATPREKPPLPAPAWPRVMTIEGVQVEELIVGDGEEVTAGRTARVHYVGRLTDGTVFDSSVERGDPFEFPYGGGRLIEGFERGMRGMRVGGKRRITIPPELGYGARAVGRSIPAHSTLVFDIELIGLR